MSDADSRETASTNVQERRGPQWGGLTAFGVWLSRQRIWGLVPLLAVGLFVHAGSISVRTGMVMMTAGAAGILAGTLLRIICRTFSPSGIIGVPHEQVLITEGPYAITRNPVYLAEVSIALGIAMMSRMPWLVLVTAIAAFLVYAPAIETQERRLRLVYPDAYAAYERLVPRWFSLRNLFDRETYMKSRQNVPLLTAVRGESLTMLIGLAAILAFLAKANFEFYL